MKVQLVCQKCGKEFERDSWNVKRGRTKFCSPDCYYASKIGTTRPDLYKRYTKVCPVCGKDFVVGGRAGRRRQITCSDKCQEQSRYRHGARANEISHDDALYMAGFIDGEGSIILTNRNNKAGVRLAVVNTNHDILLWLAEVTGVGAVCVHQAEAKHNKAGWMWNINSEAAESVLIQILPYLHIKRAQAELAIETQTRLRDPALNADRTWQAEYIVKMKTLNARANSKYYEVIA